MFLLPSQPWDIVSIVCPWQGTSLSNASFDPGKNEYLVGQIWQCVR